MKKQYYKKQKENIKVYRLWIEEEWKKVSSLLNEKIYRQNFVFITFDGERNAEIMTKQFYENNYIEKEEEENYEEHI